MGCQWEDIPRPAHKGNQGQFLGLPEHRYHPWRSTSLCYVTRGVPPLAAGCGVLGAWLPMYCGEPQETSPETENGFRQVSEVSAPQSPSTRWRGLPGGGREKLGDDIQPQRGGALLSHPLRPFAALASSPSWS